MSYCWLQGQRFEPGGLWYGICVNTLIENLLFKVCDFTCKLLETISARYLKAGNEARSRVVRVVGKCVGLTLSVGCC